jgi:methionine-rich copper-binding protein CopC
LLGSPDTVTQAPDGGSAPLTFNVRALQSGIANYRIHSIAAPGTADRVQLNGGLPGGVVTGSLSLANAESTVVVVQISYPPGSAFVPFDQVVLDVDVDGDGDLDEAEAAAVAPRSIAFAGVEEALPGLEMHAKPNPFSQSLEIAFTLARGGAVRVEAFDVAGRRVRTLQREHLAAGPHRVVWDGRDDAGHPVTGVVFVRVTSAEGSRTERAVRFER